MISVADWFKPTQLQQITEAMKMAGAIVPVHQALIEVYKLFNVRVKRYFEALSTIIYGTYKAPRHLDVFGRLANEPDGMAVSASSPDENVSRLQKDLVESFALRALGDQPVSDITEADIDNVSRIAQAASHADVQQALWIFTKLVENKVEDPRVAIGDLTVLKESTVVGDRVCRWMETLGGDQFTDKETRERNLKYFCMSCQSNLLQSFVPGEARARLGLANALRAAEFKYHGDVTRSSVALAAVEAVAIGIGTATVAGGLAAFGFLMILPRASNSLLDAITGFGDRLKK